MYEAAIQRTYRRDQQGCVALAFCLHSCRCGRSTLCCYAGGSFSLLLLLSAMAFALKPIGSRQGMTSDITAHVRNTGRKCHTDAPIA